MNIEHPWILWLIAFPLLWMALNWRTARSRSRMALKTLSITAILLALSDPQVTLLASKMAVAVLVDTSASMTPQDLRRESDLIGRMERARGRHTLQVIPFAERPRNIEPAEREKSWNLQHTAGPAGRGTNIEAAVRGGLAALPAGRVPRLVLVTDGRENSGSAARAAWQAQLLGIPIDTILLAGRPQPDLRLEAAATPTLAFAGERFPIDIVVTSPRRTRADVTFSTEDKLLGSSQVTLEQGSNHLWVRTSIPKVGTIELSGAIRAPQIGEVRFTRALSLRRPRALIVSQDSAESDSHLLKTLAAAQFEVRRATEIPADCSDYQILVLNDLNLQQTPLARKAAVEQFVKRGGGLVLISGERDIYIDEGNTPQDPLKRALPAKLAPPRRQDSVCVVLILDKSSSMEGKKIELAQRAAIGVVENLRPTDMVGILIFDDSFKWLAPIRMASEKSAISRMISGVVADGGTQIAPALGEAFRRILPVNAVYKHIILLTDGISEEGGSMTVAREAAERRITISTVGLGEDVNRVYLSSVAEIAGGESHFLSDPSGLKQTLLRDFMAHNGSTAAETDFHPVVLKRSDVLDGVGMESAPSLHGYVRFTSRPGADVVMNAQSKDPLLVRWQYGLGRAAVFTSDTKSRWAEHWVNWPGFDKLWGNVFRDLLPRAQAGEATAEYDSASDELVVDYRLGLYADDPARIPAIVAYGPQGFVRPVKVEKVAGGAYQGRVSCDNRRGLFRVRPVTESRVFPEVGLYRQEEELNGYGSDEALLRGVSAYTRGNFNPDPADIFDGGGRTAASTLRLWPSLVVLALGLGLLELILRKRRETSLRLETQPA